MYCLVEECKNVLDLVHYLHVHVHNTHFLFLVELYENCDEQECIRIEDEVLENNETSIIFTGLNSDTLYKVLCT